MANLERRVKKIEARLEPEREERVVFELVYKDKLNPEKTIVREIESDIFMPRKRI